MNLSHRARHAFKWSILGEAATKIIGPLSFLILARLLVPEDFGVVAAATVVISFSQVFSDAGLAKALIQRRDRTEESANVVFWLNLLIGAFLTILLIIFAPYIGIFFKDPRISPVVRVLSLQIIFVAFSSVQTALLQKDFKFKRLFWIRAATTFVPAFLAIPLALSGMGYWALVASSLIGQVLLSAILWLQSSWRPQFRFDRQLTKQLLTFGKWAMFSGVLGWFYGWMDAIVVGHYLGAHDMGLYRTGNIFVTTMLGLLFAPLLPVLYSLFSAQQDVNKVAGTLLIVVRSITLISIPVAALMVVFHQEIETLLFSQQWEGIGIAIALLAATHGIAWVVGANGEAYRAIGKPHLETLAMALSLLVYLCGYLISVEYGLFVFLLTRLALVFAGLLVQIIIAKQELGIPLMSWIENCYKPFGFIFLSSLGFFIASGAIPISLINKTFFVLITTFVYVAYIAITEKNIVSNILSKNMTIVMPKTESQK